MADRPAGPSRANRAVVFMAAARYSGSTLLGIMLGAHPSIFYAGEANKIWQFADPEMPFRNRVCAVCGPACSVWHDLRTGSRENLYDILSKRTGRPIVFDSTKGTNRIMPQVTALQGVVPLCLVVLTRDGRAVVNSDVRKWPEISAGEHAAAWVERMRDVERLASGWPGTVHRLRYEELATRPEPTLRAMAEFLGVDFDTRMLNPWASEQHPVGGNPGTIRQLSQGWASDDWNAARPTRATLDLRWTWEMDAASLDTFDAVAGETNRDYAWDGDAGRDAGGRHG